jgi:hypothetical protein
MSERMEEFEMWWSENGWRACDSQHCDYDGYKAACRIAWLAAQPRRECNNGGE